MGAAAGRPSATRWPARRIVTRLPATWEAATGPCGRRPLPVEAWAGPWPIVERWWSAEASRRAFLQVALRDDAGNTAAALLVALHEGRWMLEAVYD